MRSDSSRLVKDVSGQPEHSAHQITRRRLLKTSALAGIGLVGGWLAWPERAAALLCSCDIWFCGVYDPVAFEPGGGNIVVNGAIWARGKLNLGVRVKVTQASTGAVAETSATITDTIASDVDVWLPWEYALENTGPAPFEKGSALVEVWVDSDNLPQANWQKERRLVQIGANEHFRRTWTRTDKPVLVGEVSRTWMWGLEAFTPELTEEYAEAPGGQRTVQYYDKSRMEITHPDDDPTAIWYVTNGLLVNELITGSLQVGDTAFVEREPAGVNVAGDADDVNGPTYATFGAVLDGGPLPPGATITQRIDRAGNVSDDPVLAAENVTLELVDDVTGHAIAAPFWAFMNSSDIVWERGEFVTANLFVDPYYATGRPITEPYWADVKVAGTVQSVLVQCFERRCLTYTPANDPNWRVEAGNVGRHYYQWRYE